MTSLVETIAADRAKARITSGIDRQNGTRGIPAVLRKMTAETHQYYRMLRGHFPVDFPLGGVDHGHGVTPLHRVLHALIRSPLLNTESELP